MKNLYFRYMGTMYTLDAFKTSCPADQDIISHYKMQQVYPMDNNDPGAVFLKEHIGHKQLKNFFNFTLTRKLFTLFLPRFFM